MLLLPVSPLCFFCRHEIKVLIPGAGLGRLCWECIKLGFSVEGNEVSYHMLLSSDYILNR